LTNATVNLNVPGMTAVTNALAWANYTYDKGRLATKSYGNSDTVSYGYDLESRLTNLTIGSGVASLLSCFG
jgi:hypothetical protein